MTSRLAEAFEKASHLPESLQNTIADELIAEIDGEFLFDDALEGSQDVLAQLIAEAQTEVREGKVSEADWGKE